MRKPAGAIVVNTRSIINNTRLAFKNYEEFLDVNYEKMLFVTVGLLAQSDYTVEIDELVTEILDFECIIFDNDRDLIVLGKHDEDVDTDVMTMNVTNILAMHFLCPLAELLNDHEYFSRHLRHYVFSHVTSTHDIVLEPRTKENSGV